MKAEGKYKVGMLSLGCPRNLVDSEGILGRLSDKGYPVTDLEHADIAIVNTCAFIEEAKRESIEAILELADLKKEGRLKKIIVCGCLAQRYRYELKKELPEVDAFVGKVSLNHEFNRFALTARHYAYLKICEGCVNNCSYCAIPKIKGRFASLGQEGVLDKVEAFDNDKISELNIIGQDLTGYGLDLFGRSKLPELLREIIKKAKHIGWIRMLYLYPGPVIDELLNIIKDSPQVCRYVDLPIQHINDRILKIMNRRTTGLEIMKIIEKVRKALPDAAIRTSLIVGFPSETDREFKELLDFVKSVKFERLGAFIYSREEGTRAYGFKNQVSRRTKVQRLDAIMSAQRVISEELNLRFVGRYMDVLIEGKENGRYLGRSQYDAPEVDGLVYVDSKNELKPGDFARVKITDSLEYDLLGEVSG
ncbi:MAG: MiaB/RimO family radical SAM methylthiotransferase [Deltaproteobacteria bacterium]